MSGEQGNASNNSFGFLNDDFLLLSEATGVRGSQGQIYGGVDSSLSDPLLEDSADPNLYQQSTSGMEDIEQRGSVEDPFGFNQPIFDTTYDPSYLDPSSVFNQSSTDPYMGHSGSWFGDLYNPQSTELTPFEAPTNPQQISLNSASYSSFDLTAQHSIGPYYPQPAHTTTLQGPMPPIGPHPQLFLDQLYPTSTVNSSVVEPHANQYGTQFVNPYQTHTTPPSLHSPYNWPMPTFGVPTTVNNGSGMPPGPPSQTHSQLEGTSTTLTESYSTTNIASSTSTAFDYFAVPVGSNIPRTSYVIEPEHDSSYLEDFTGFMPDQAWLSEDNLPPALGMLEPIFKVIAKQDTGRLDRSVASGPYVPRLMFNHIMPSRISWKVEGWRTAHWKSLDSRITNDDIIDRMFWTTYVDSENDVCPYSHRDIIRAQITERERKWRLRAGGLARREASKDRVSQDSLTIMDRVVKNADPTDPNGVLRACLHNTVWKIDFTDMTISQPKPVFPKNKKNKAENYLGQKFPLPQAKTELSERVLKVYNRLNKLSEEGPDVNPAEAQEQAQKRKNNWAKRKETIKANKDSGRMYRAPAEGKRWASVRKQRSALIGSSSQAPSLTLPHPPLQKPATQNENDTTASFKPLRTTIASERSRKRQCKDLEVGDHESSSKSLKSSSAVRTKKS